ncbi:PIN domain-containing protein [Pedobacter terrae]|uniref:PIN domain-containing protein n=1 Tax=Pedobacter terrae TaxID=405671 RepID=UPI002FF6AA90
MPLTTILAALSAFLPETLAGYFIGKGMDKFLDPGVSLKDELQDVIQDTVVEYSDNDNRNYGPKSPFYHSTSIVEGLLKFRVMAPEDYDTSELIRALENEADIVPPTDGELENFYNLFMSKVSQSENLRKLEIKETYTQEIFAISRKITELSARIENLAKQYTADLELQWKDRVTTYVKTLQDFKPATALGLLESLESSIQTSTNRPSQNFIAFLEYQKGQCLGFLSRRGDLFRAKLKAWNLDGHNVLYGQSAAICLYRARDTNQANQVITEIFALDPFNPVAWALDTLAKTEPGQLTGALANVPVVVYNDPTFKRVLFSEASEEFQRFMLDEGIVPDLFDYQVKEVTVDGYYEAVFWINIAVRKIFRMYFLDYRENNQEFRREITLLNSMLTRFLGKVKGSEITDSFERLEFLLALTEFSLTSDKEKAIEMETIYQRTVRKEPVMAIQTANALQLSGMVDRAINLLENETDLISEALLLLLNCYQQKEDWVGYCDASKRFAASITIFDSKYLLMYLNLMIEIKLMNLLENFSKDDFISGKTFSDQETEQLVTEVATLIFDSTVEEDSAYLQQIALSSEDSKLVDILGSAFFASGVYQVALNILARNINGKSAGRELYQYIHAANKTGSDYIELLSLLEHWRLNSPFSHQFCRLEIQLRQDLVDWKTIVDICEYYLEHLPDDSAILALYANSLHLLNDSQYNQKISTLAERARLSDFHRPNHLIAVCDVLFMHGFAEAAFELLYPKALNPAAIELRAAYAKLVLNRDDNYNFFKEYDTVEAGHFVKFEREGQVSYVELAGDALNHRVYKLFPGKRKGDSVTVTRQLNNLSDTFKITRVMNKYLALFDQILNQSREDPYAGLPFSVMNIDAENPGSFFETMWAMFGDSHKIAEQTKEISFNKYYRGDISLSEIISSEYNQKFISGYYNLIRYHNGINTIRLQEFANRQILASNQMVIDFSALLLFHQISTFHQYQFPAKFILSKYVLERIRYELSSLQYKVDRFDSSGIEVGKVAINDPSFDFLKDQVAYLESLLTWIADNCDVLLSDQTIDALKQTPVNLGENPIIDFAISTLLLMTDDPNRLLITDDTFSLRMGLLPFERIVSSEYYLKSICRDNSEISKEIVRNRYIGYSPNEKQLSEEYAKFISGSYSNYALLLSNLSVINSVENVTTTTTHLKEIALKPMLTNEQILNDMTIVLTNALQVCTESFINLFGQKVFLDFRLLGEKQDIAIQAVYDAKHIILSARRNNL